MSVKNLDVFLDTFGAELESASLCLENGKLFHDKIKLLEKMLLEYSPDLVAQLENQSLTSNQIKKIKEIINLIKDLELKSNAKLNWFQDLDKHLKQTLANEI